MANTNTQINTFSRVRGLFQLMGWYLGQLIPIAAFLFVSLLPTEALAATQASNMPLAVWVPVPPFRGDIRPGMVLGVTSTAYSSSVSQTDSTPLITASGARVRPGVAAANFLPFGTVVRIGDMDYTILDRMAARNEGVYRIDIWMKSDQAARIYGVRTHYVTVLSMPR